MDKVERIITNTEEIVTAGELKTVLGKSKPKAYIGFEPSGTVHLGGRFVRIRLRISWIVVLILQCFLQIGMRILTISLTEILRRSSFVDDIWKIVSLRWV